MSHAIQTRMTNVQKQLQTSQQRGVASAGPPLQSLPEHGFWARFISFFLQCISVNYCIEDYANSPFVNEHIVNYDPPRPQSRMAYLTTPADRAGYSSLSLRSANIRKRNGKWMVSHPLDAEESMFIQFPHLNDDDFRSSDEGTAQAGSSDTRIKKSAGKGGSERQEHKKTTSKAESDSDMEWYLL